MQSSDAVGQQVFALADLFTVDLGGNSAAGVLRLAFSQAHELAPHGCTAVALTPGWLRSEMMLDAFRVTEANWRDALAFQPQFDELRDKHNVLMLHGTIEGETADAKLRYYRPKRIEMNRNKLGLIRSNAPTVKVYLCMESKHVWQEVFGYAPSCEKELGAQLGPHV